MSLPAPLAAARDAARAGAAWVLDRLDRPVLVLLYHRVCELGSDPQQLAVAPSRFRAHLELIARSHPIVRFEADWAAARRPAVCVTFDDGYADNLLHALPILEETGVPAAFFITTGNVESGREFWWDELERLVLGRGGSPRFELRDPRCGGSWPAATVEERQSLYAALHAGMMRVDAPRREDWLGQLRTWAGDGGGTRATHRPLTVDELRRLGASPLATVGAHGVTHTRLAALDQARQRQEIAGSRTRLESWLGRPVEWFSYPFGTRGDFGARAQALCREAGFQKAAANLQGCARRWTDPFRVPRHVVRDWDAAGLERRLARFFLS